MISKPSNRIVLQIILFTCLLFIPDKILLAQSVRYEIEEVPYTEEIEGLEGTSILQDSDGFMWFGSTQGLYRYDGANFKRYLYDPLRYKESVHDSAGLVNDWVHSLVEDSEGTIWFSNFHVLTRFDRRTETFKHFTDTFLREELWCLLEGRDGYLWVGSHNGLCRFDTKTGIFKYYPQYESVTFDSPKKPVYKIYEDKKGSLWLRHTYGIVSIFNRETETFEIIKNAPSNIHNFYEDRSGRFWVTSENGLYQYNRKSKTFQRYLYEPGNPNSIYSQNIESIIQDDAGNLWMNTYEGIYQYNKNLEKLNFWKHPGEFDSVNKNDLLQNVTKLLYADNGGTIWFFTIKGIGKLIKRFNNFTVYRPVKIPDTRSSVTNDGNKIYFSSWSSRQLYRGVYVLDPKTRTYAKLIVDSENDIDNYGFLITDHKGTLWVATKGRGLYKGIINEDGIVKFKQVFSNPDDSANVPGLIIHHLFEDSKGRIWIQAHGHFPCYYDPEQDRIIHLVNNPKSTDKLPDSPIKIAGIADKGVTECSVQGETNSGILLAGRKVHGIFAIIPPFIRVSEHAVMPTDIIKFRSESGENLITGVYMYQSPLDSLGIIWTKGTYPDSYGFQKLTLVDNYGKNKFIVRSRIYTVKNGLPCHQIGSFIEDSNGNFWLGTYRGLSKFNPSKETFTNYTIQDGLPTSHFLSNKVQSYDGELFFVTTKGFISFYPDSIRYNSKIPPVVLTKLKINQQSISPLESSILDKLVTYSDFIELSYKQNNMSFEYAALNYIQSSRNQYKYQLEGFDKDWIYASNRTNVDYTNLKPGTYTFRVSGSNNDGVWNEEGATLQIIIHPPPWKTVWAYIIYGFILIGLILWYRRFLLNRAQIKTALEVERVEKEKVQELDHMKSRFFANISHEFRTPLTLILGPVEDTLKTKISKIVTNRGVFEMIKRNAQRLQRLINQLLDISKLETGKVELQISEGNLEELVKTIVLSFLSLAETKNIKYKFDIPETNMKVYFDKDKVDKIITNLISNAFKFTQENGKVSVSLRYITSEKSDTPQFVDITVSDTGKGIPEEQLEKIFDRFYQVSDSDTRDVEGTGIGLALTKELVNLIRGEITVESEVGKGSIFRIKFPVSKEHFTDKEIIKVSEEKVFRTESPEPEEYIEEQELSEIKERTTPKKSELESVILIVEDNADLRNYLSGILGTYYQIHTAVNGRKGLKHATDIIPDLIISDIMMPEMDGIEMCQKLRNDEKTNHIPIIMLTAKADIDSKLKGLETGADDYLIKPFNADELQIRVKNLIDQRKRLSEKFTRDFFLRDQKPELTSLDERFIKKAQDIIEVHLSDPDFNVQIFSQLLGISAMQLYRKLQAITNQSPSEFIRKLRLKYSIILLRKGYDNIAQIAYQVGFNDHSYYTKCFHELYGVTPSEFIDGNKGSAAIISE